MMDCEPVIQATEGALVGALIAVCFIVAILFMVFLFRE